MFRSMGNQGKSLESCLVCSHFTYKSGVRLALFVLALLTITEFGHCISTSWDQNAQSESRVNTGRSEVIESEKGVVAADDARCSEIGASMLRQGGHAVDAAVATTLCLGVVNPMASGIGGGAFMVVRSASSHQAIAFNMRETAPAAASQNMYMNNTDAKFKGPLSMAVPGEIAGLHKAWKKYGRLPWKTLFQPAVNLAKNGFEVFPYLANSIANSKQMIMADPGLRQVFAPNGNVLQSGDKCYNKKLALTLKLVAIQGPQAFYNGKIGKRLIRDVRKSGGILTMNDLRNYKVRVTNALAVDVMGYKILGMPPPSSGTVGLSLILNILSNYKNKTELGEPLGLHRLVEAMKHMFAIRMNLGDPAFVDVSKYISDMSSPSFAKKLWYKINDNTTFPPNYYLNRWSQLHDNGTSHFCIVDAERNAVSVTSTVNYAFGAGMISPSTGILLNNEMDDFSIPTEIAPDRLPPAPANFIRPGKRPLSSMTPLIVLKNDQLAGVIGGSGGINIIPAVTQVFINNFVLRKDPLTSVQSPRVYHKLMPNIVSYENFTAINRKHVELSEEKIAFLKQRSHELEAVGVKAISQLIIQTFRNSADVNNKMGLLTGVSDLRKDGKPAAV